MSERPFGNYCHKHSKGMYSRCQDCIDELTALGIQSDKDKIAELDAEVRELRNANSLLREENERLRIENAALRADSARIDWLADVNNTVGSVVLPREIVEANVSSLRQAIDAARGAS